MGLASTLVRKSDSKLLYELMYNFLIWEDCYFFINKMEKAWTQSSSFSRGFSESQRRALLVDNVVRFKQFKNLIYLNIALNGSLDLADSACTELKEWLGCLYEKSQEDQAYRQFHFSLNYEMICDDEAIHYVNLWL